MVNLDDCVDRGRGDFRGQVPHIGSHDRHLQLALEFPGCLLARSQRLE